MNLLVGATGFVGGHLVEYLFQQGEISKGIFRMGSHLKIMDANGVQGLEADLLDHHSLHEAVEGVDVVYNLASPMPDTDEDFLKVNTEGLLNLMEVASEAKVKSFVHLSTLDVYGFGSKLVSLSTPIHPTEGYQKSKAEAERLLLEHSKRSSQPRITIIRAAKAVGSRDESVVVPILKMIDSGKVTVPSSGKMSFSHPRDIAQAMFGASAGTSPAGSVYLVKSFDSTPVDLAEGVVSALGGDARVGKAGVFSGSSFPTYAKEQLRGSVSIDPQMNWGEISYVPKYDLKSTCDEIANWYRKEPWAAGTD